MNLNKGISKPSETLVLKNILTRTLKNQNKRVNEIDRILESRSGQIKLGSNAVIDFYDMINKKNKIECKTEEMHSIHDFSKQDEEIRRMDFYIVALKNDLRVRNYWQRRNEIFVRFWTAGEAISYYKQHIELLEMEFTEIWEFQSERQEAEGYAKIVKECSRVEQNNLKKEFDMKVGLFEGLKGFFTKNEIKRMEEMSGEGDFEFIYDKGKEVACGCASNVIMQQAVRKMTDEQLCKLLTCLGQDIVPLAATKHGAYSVQAVLENAHSQLSQCLISSNFKKYGKFLMCHEIGNYSIQKLLFFNRSLVFELCLANLREIVSSPLGIKVLKRCVSFFHDWHGRIARELKSVMSPENTKNCKMVLALLSSN